MTPRPRRRCDWCGGDPLFVAYHDREWGRPCRDDRTLFEFLVLEGFQAGLSWITILRKRGNFRRAFHNWDWRVVAAFGPADVRRLLADPGIVRNRLKVAASIGNAQAFMRVRAEFGTFSSYLWRFTGGRTIVPHRRPRRFTDLPTRSAVSDALSADLRRRGFRFVGTTICYSYLQAMGLVDDHVAGCFRAGRRAH